MTNRDIKNGDSNIGRVPIERLIMFLEKKGIVRQVTNILVLIILIGINSHIHYETDKGVQFLLIVFLILFSGNKPTTNFFGASTLSIFIIIHLSMYGFNALALMLTFTIFLIFLKGLENNFLGPISIYLIIDSAFIYFDLQFSNLFHFLSNFLFSETTIIILSLIPHTYLFIFLERQGKKISNNTIINDYIVYMLLFILFWLLYVLGMIMDSNILINSSPFMLILYFIGLLLNHHDIKKFFLLLIPIGLIILILHML